MIGWIIAGLLAAALVTTIVIYGTITRAKIRYEMQQRDIAKLLVKEANTTTNVVKAEDVLSGDIYEFDGDDIDWDIDEGDYIYA